MVSSVRPKKQQNFYNKNLQWLQQRAPKSVTYLQTKTPDIEVIPGTARSGKAYLTLRKNNQLIHLHSSYDPVAEAEYWAKEAGQGDWQIGVVFGVGLGYHLEALQRLYPEKSLVVIEPLPDIFNATIQIRDLRSLMPHKNYPILFNPDAHDAAISLFENHLSSNILKGRIEFLAWPPYQRIWSTFWQEIQRQIGDLARQAYVNVGTYQYFSTQWQENFFTNLRASVTDPSVTSLYSLFQGKPAILVSAGPSLQKNIHLLAEVQDKALIVAAGSAIGPLLAHGIKPHLVVSFDGGAANYYVFADLAAQTLPLVYSSVIYPRILAEHKGPRFALGVDIYPFERWFYEQLGQDRGNIACGPSVANLTWDLLRQMNCEPIILIGQDLAYGDTGQTHAAGHVEVEHRIENSDQDTQTAVIAAEWVEDIWGNQVRTTSVWLTMKIWFEQRIRAWGQGRTFIDATEGGAKIAGTQIMTLQEAITAYCQQSFDPQALILKAYQHEESHLASLDIDTKVDLTLQQIERELDQIVQLCDESINPLQEFRETNHNGRLNGSEFARVHSVLKHLESQISNSDVYIHFVSVSTRGSQSAFDALTVQLESESDLQKKGNQLVDLYAARFATIRKAALAIKSCHRIAADLPQPYAPPALAEELARISGILRLMHPLVDRLQYISTLAMDEAVDSEATSLHRELDKFAAEFSQTEIMRRFVKDILERDTTPVQRLCIVSAAVDGESDLQKKARYLAEYHTLFLRMIEDAVTQIRTYSQIPPKRSDKSG